MPIQCFKIGLELFLQGQRTREIVRGEDIPLHLAEDDLDLIEPTGVRRQPVNPDFTCQRQRRNPRSELFGGMRRAVIEHQMDDLQPCAQGTQKQLPQDGCEIGTFSPAACPCNRHSRSDHQGTEQLHGTHPFLPLRDVDRGPWRRGFGRTDTLPGLDGGLLITAHPRFPLCCQRLGVFVALEHRRGLVHKVWSSRVLPRVRAPRFDLVRAPPGPDRPRRDVRHDLLFDGDLGELLPRPARPGFAVCAWRTTGQRDNLGPLERREGPAGTSPRGITHAVGRRPALSPVPDSLDTAAYLPGDLRISPQGMLMGKQENPRALDVRKRGRITGAEVCRCPSCSRVSWMGYLGKGPGIRIVLLIKHKIGGLSYVRTLLMSNPPRIYCAQH